VPKGVEVPHRGLRNLVNWHVREYGIKGEDRATQLAGVGFDASVWELWPYLAMGASVHIASGQVRQSAEELKEWLIGEEITVSFVPTPMAEALLGLDWERELKLRAMLTGGDRLRPRRPG
jgi:non-ribosomal peptide synthetase component F